MAKFAQLPDGTRIKFPDDATVEEMTDVVNRPTPNPYHLSLILEAEKRGILPPEKAALLAEARKRGLVPGVAPAAPLGPSANLGETDPELMAQPGTAGLGMFPVLGGVGGTIAGTALGNPYMGAITGAGLGSTVEQYVKSLQPGDTVPTEERVKDVMGNMILAPIGAGAGAAINPSAAKVAPEALEAARFAAKNALPIRLSEVRPSWITKFMDDVSGAFATGRYKNLKYAEDANGFLANARSNILDALTGVGDTTKIPIAALPGKVRPSLRLKTTSAYEEALKTIGDAETVIPAHEMRKTAGELMKDAAVQNAKRNRGAKVEPVTWLRNFLDASNDGVKFSDLHKYQSEINRTFYGAGGEANTKLLQSFADDLVNWDAGVGQKLNEAYTVARAQSKNEHLFDTVYGVLRGATTVDKNTQAELLDGARLLARLQTPVKGSTILTPERKILETMGPEKGQQILNDLRDLANYAIHTRKLRSETGSGLNVLTAITGGASLYPKSVTGVLVPQGTSLAMTVLMTGPGWKGGLRNYLLKGIKPTLRLGVQGAVQGAGSRMLDPTQGGAVPLR